MEKNLILQFGIDDDTITVYEEQESNGSEYLVHELKFDAYSVSFRPVRFETHFPSFEDAWSYIKTEYPYWYVKEPSQILGKQIKERIAAELFLLNLCGQVPLDFYNPEYNKWKMLSKTALYILMILLKAFIW